GQAVDLPFEREPTMSDACGCGHDETPPAGVSDEHDEHQAERLWGVRELQFAAVAGALLLGGLLAGGTEQPTVRRTLNWAALLVGGWTFVPGTLRRLGKRKIGVGTLMTIAAIGAVLLGEVAEAAALAFLFSISEGLEEYSLARTPRGLRALLGLV